MWSYDIRQYSYFNEDEVLIEPFLSLFMEDMKMEGDVLRVVGIDNGGTKVILSDKILFCKAKSEEEELFEDGIELHREGRHSEAVRKYEEGVVKKCQLSCLNLGNCFYLEWEWEGI